MPDTVVDIIKEKASTGTRRNGKIFICDPRSHPDNDRRNRDVGGKYAMKARMRYGIVVLCAMLLVSCGTGLKEIMLKSKSARTDVFKEVREGESIPREFVELTITSSIKTHLEGFYVAESKKSLHGKPGYPFVLNIDGQAVTWKVDGQEEDTPTYDQSGKISPEGGEGMRYNLQKKILLRGGPHKIFFGLPEEKFLLQFELALKEGESYVLEFRPAYRHRGKQPPHFVHGVSGIEVVLNGNVIALE